MPFWIEQQILHDPNLPVDDTIEWIEENAQKPDDTFEDKNGGVWLQTVCLGGPYVDETEAWKSLNLYWDANEDERLGERTMTTKERTYNHRLYCENEVLRVLRLVPHRAKRADQIERAFRYHPNKRDDKFDVFNALRRLERRGAITTIIWSRGWWQRKYYIVETIEASETNEILGQLQFLHALLKRKGDESRAKSPWSIELLNEWIAQREPIDREIRARNRHLLMLAGAK